MWPSVEVVVQPSEIRAIPDQEYVQAGVKLQEDLSDCDILLGVKEVPCEQLIPEKTYLFFSHTFKKQEYNKELLRCILEKKVRLIDYEVLTAEDGRRLIGFGRYAGVVGAYNGFLAWGEKTGDYVLKPANACEDRKEMEKELSKVNLPYDFKLVLTGNGRVARGAMEILDALEIKKVTPEEIATQEFKEPVYSQLLVTDYNQRKDGEPFSRGDFYKYPVGYKSNFMRFAKVSDMYLACHYWDNRSPYIFTREDAKSEDFNIKVVADISCDIDCAVASTLRPATIEEPMYGYDPVAEKEVDFYEPNSIGVMAVDNLPCELPRDASEDFGIELINNVLPSLIEQDSEGIIERATQTNLQGQLTAPFLYLEDWVQAD